jgi:hypothetical protein
MKTQLAAITGAALCVLAAGCGSTPAPVHLGQLPGAGLGSRPAARTTSHGGPTAAGNRRLAEREALRLLSLAPVPAHAVRLGSPPSSLAYPAMGLPDVQSLVDQSRSWRLPMSYRAAVSWLAAHQPAGLPQDGSSRSYLSDSQSAGFGYTGQGNRAWQSAELDVEVAPSGDGGSVLRADGLVVWLDPVPARDTEAGRRLRVLASARCPRTDAGAAGVTNTGGGLARALVPRGLAQAGLTCTYYGMNGRAWQLKSQRRLTAAQARRLAAAMARLPLSHTVGGVVSCPMDDGSAELIALSYRSRPDVDLWRNLNGCGGVSNGYITTSIP